MSIKLRLIHSNIAVRNLICIYIVHESGMRRNRENKISSQECCKNLYSGFVNGQLIN